MELDKQSLEKIYDKFGSDIINVLTKELISAGKKSNTLIDSLNVELKPLADGISLLIQSEDYLTYVDQGRKKGSYPPIKEISKWATKKNIPQSAVWGIATNIFKFGIKPTNVIQKTLNKINPLIDKMEIELVKQIEIDLIKNIEKNK